MAEASVVKSQSATQEISLAEVVVDMGAKTLRVANDRFDLDETTYGALKTFLDAQLPTAPDYSDHTIPAWGA